MLNWWNELNTMQQIFATVAIPATLVMVIQTVLFFFGLNDGDDGSDISGLHDDITSHDGHMEHGDADAIRLFTVRGLVAFFSIGGWMGLVASGWELTTPIVVILAFAAGGAALYFVAWTLKAANKLQSSGNINIDNTIGKKGEVYLTIPASNAGTGKVNVLVQERLCEFEAVTEADRNIKSGESIIVIAIAREGVLLVSPDETESFRMH